MSAYARNFDAALERTGIRNAFVAEKLGVPRTLVSMWRRGRQPMPAVYARSVGAIVGEAPARISSAYDELVVAGVIPDARHGATPPDHVRIPALAEFDRSGQAHDSYLPELIARRRAGSTPIEHLRWTLQTSQALAPLIERDALLLIDTRFTRHADVSDGGLYALTLWGRPDIRKILIRRDRWVLTSQDQDAERSEVSNKELSQLRLFGMVVGWI
jgi:hypothetical protein